jgi:putative ABC transport system permease protein
MNDNAWGVAWGAAFRQLRRAPAYSTMMVATLAIGVAAAAAIFSVVRGVILRPLPYSAPDRLVSVAEYQPAQQRDQTTVASANFPQIAGARSFAGAAAFTYSEYVVSDDRDAERLLGARIDANLFDVLGVRPALGRGIERGEGGNSPASVALLSDALWRRRFGADPRAVGRSLTVDGAPYTIIGIMPRGFEFPRNAAMSKDVDLWVPRRPTNPMMLRRGIRDLTVLARMRPGVERDAAQNELSTISDRLREQNADHEPARYDRRWRPPDAFHARRLRCAAAFDQRTQRVRGGARPHYDAATIVRRAVSTWRDAG